MPRSMAGHFNCPNCNALYQLVKAEAGPETNNRREITCRACGGPLPGRDGDIRLQIFSVAESRPPPDMGAPPDEARRTYLNQARRIAANIAKLPADDPTLIDRL